MSLQKYKFLILYKIQYIFACERAFFFLGILAETSKLLRNFRVSNVSIQKFIEK